MNEPADLGVLEAAGLLARRELSSRELVTSCLQRIVERDGTHSHDGASHDGAINAWMRVYEEDALASAERSDERRGRDDSSVLGGIPIGLNDLFAVRGTPLAAPRALADVPVRHSAVWARLEAAGMVLLGHLHTHEFSDGGTTSQVGNPWSLDRSAGGSSGGSAAALAAGMTPAATGTDTSGCLRVASALCGTSTIKPSYGLVPLRGIVPFAPTLDHAGPMARNVVDLEPLLAAMARVAPPTERRPLRRIAVSPRLALVELDTDVADGFDATCRIVGAELIAVSPPDVELECRLRFRDVLCTGMLAYHRRFADRRSLYSPSIRGFLEDGEKRQLPAEDYVEIQERRVEETARWIDWFAEHEVDALVEPTVPTVAPPRGDRDDEAFLQGDEISLTHYWNWTGFPVVALPSGIGRRSGLPTSVSIVGPPQSDWDLLAAGAALQAELGTMAQ